LKRDAVRLDAGPPGLRADPLADGVIGAILGPRADNAPSEGPDMAAIGLLNREIARWQSNADLAGWRAGADLPPHAAAAAGSSCQSPFIASSAASPDIACRSRILPDRSTHEDDVV